MKKLVSKQKNCLIAMIILIVVCEILLKVDNKIIQSIGICLTPIIVYLGLLLIKKDQKKELNEKER